MKRKYCAHSYINEENVFFVQSLHKLNYHKLAIYTCSPKGTDPEMKMKLPQGENSNTFPFIVNMVCNEKISTVIGCESRLGGSVCAVCKYGLSEEAATGLPPATLRSLEVGRSWHYQTYLHFTFIVSRFKLATGYIAGFLRFSRRLIFPLRHLNHSLSILHKPWMSSPPSPIS